MGLLSDYSRQALEYDRTRGASPSVLEPLRAALHPAPGRRLADIGGGTGNYALALREDGFDPLVIDRSEAMLARAVEKGLRTLRADAQELPLADESFDAAILISMLHHVDDMGAALREAHRIVVGAGRVVAMVFTREDIEAFWPLEYFPSSRPWMEATHPPLDQLLAMVEGGKRTEIVFQDTEDGSLAASAARPELILDRCQRTQISFFERLERCRRRSRAGSERARACEPPGLARRVSRDR